MKRKFDRFMRILMLIFVMIIASCGAVGPLQMHRREKHQDDEIKTEWVEQINAQKEDQEESVAELKM